MTAVSAPRRTLSWTGTLPPDESVIERTDRQALTSPDAPPPRSVGSYRNDRPTLLRVLEGLTAL